VSSLVLSNFRRIVTFISCLDVVEAEGVLNLTFKVVLVLHRGASAWLELAHEVNGLVPGVVVVHGTVASTLQHFFFNSSAKAGVGRKFVARRSISLGDIYLSFMWKRILAD